MPLRARFDPQWTPQGRYGRAEDIEIGRLTDFEMTFGDLLFACRFQAKRGADRLFVMLRSSRNLPFAPIPVFYDACTPGEMSGHILHVCDPTLSFDEGLATGIFYGTRKDDAVTGLIKIAEKVASLLGLDRTRIVYWAPSAAAMGAAMAAIRSGTVGVLVNPFLDSINMNRSYIARAVAAIFGTATVEEIAEKFPMRTRVPAALAAAQALGIRPKLLIVQNTMDVWFFRRQYVQFCRQYSIPLKGGWDPTGGIMSMVYSDRSGHAPETPEVRARILGEALPQMVEEMLTSASGPKRVCEVSVNSIGRNVYSIPPGVSSVRLVSEAATYAHDPRTLGAAITRISVDGEPISMADPLLHDGFHDLEREGVRTWRWTNGEAEVPILEYGKDRALEIEVAALSSDHDSDPWPHASEAPSRKAK